MRLSSGWLLDFGQGTWISPGGIEHNPAAFWFHRLLEDPVFAKQLKARYAELRKPGGSFNNAHIASLIGQFHATIGTVGERNEARWKGTYFNPLNSVIFHAPPFASGYEKNVELLSAWINDRLTWMDENISEIEIRKPFIL